jgi:serine/threonine-protein kinase
MSVDGPDFPADGRPTLGRYVLVREIARSNDVVWEALDPRMGRRLALKELALPPTLRGQPRRERVERFFREARAAGAMSHPGIVTVYEVGEEDGRYFIAMEFLEGHTLRERLAAAGGGPLPLPEAARVLCRLCEALAYAHARGVVHRDVKPDNVHLLPGPGGGPGGAVKLTDFGIARITHEDALTLDGQVFGTPSYMSPEQVVGKRIDARSDLFSLGVVLYEMLTGRKPFAGDSVVTITYRIMNDEMPPLTANGGSPVSAALEAVLRRALAKQPDARYQSADELRDAFLAATSGLLHAHNGLAPENHGNPGGLPFATGPRAAAAPPAAAARPSAAATVAYSGEAARSLAPTAAAGTPASSPSVASTLLSPVVAAPAADRDPYRRARRSLATILLSVVLLAGIMVGGAWVLSKAYRNFQSDARRAADLRTYESASRYYEAGQFEDAAGAFKRLRERSQDPEIRRKALLGELYSYRQIGARFLQQRDYASAERWFRAAVALAPDDEQANRELRDVLQIQGQPPDTPQRPVLVPPASTVPPADAPTTPPGRWPSSSTPPRAADFLAANAQAAAQAERLLEQGDDAWRGGDRNRAVQLWTQATMTGPGSPAALRAQQRVNASNTDDPLR